MNGTLREKKEKRGLWQPGLVCLLSVHFSDNIYSTSIDAKEEDVSDDDGTAGQTHRAALNQRIHGVNEYNLEEMEARRDDRGGRAGRGGRVARGARGGGNVRGRGRQPLAIGDDGSFQIGRRVQAPASNTLVQRFTSKTKKPAPSPMPPPPKSPGKKKANEPVPPPAPPRKLPAWQPPPPSPKSETTKSATAAKPRRLPPQQPMAMSSSVRPTFEVTKPLMGNDEFMEMVRKREEAKEAAKKGDQLPVNQPTQKAKDKPAVPASSAQTAPSKAKSVLPIETVLPKEEKIRTQEESASNGFHEESAAAQDVPSDSPKETKTTLTAMEDNDEAVFEDDDAEETAMNATAMDAAKEPVEALEESFRTLSVEDMVTVQDPSRNSSWAEVRVKLPPATIPTASNARSKEAILLDIEHEEVFLDLLGQTYPDTKVELHTQLAYEKIGDYRRELSKIIRPPPGFMTSVHDSTQTTPMASYETSARVVDETTAATGQSHAADGHTQEMAIGLRRRRSSAQPNLSPIAEELKGSSSASPGDVDISGSKNQSTAENKTGGQGRKSAEMAKDNIPVEVKKEPTGIAKRGQLMDGVYAPGVRSEPLAKAGYRRYTLAEIIALNPLRRTSDSALEDRVYLDPAKFPNRRVTVEEIERVQAKQASKANKAREEANTSDRTQEGQAENAKTVIAAAKVAREVTNVPPRSQEETLATRNPFAVPRDPSGQAQKAEPVSRPVTPETPPPPKRSNEEATESPNLMEISPAALPSYAHNLIPTIAEPVFTDKEPVIKREASPAADDAKSSVSGLTTAARIKRNSELLLEEMTGHPAAISNLAINPAAVKTEDTTTAEQEAEQSYSAKKIEAFLKPKPRSNALPIVKPPPGYVEPPRPAGGLMGSKYSKVPDDEQRRSDEINKPISHFFQSYNKSRAKSKHQLPEWFVAETQGGLSKSTSTTSINKMKENEPPASVHDESREPSRGRKRVKDPFIRMPPHHTGGRK